MKTIAYIRVSTKKQADEGFSLENQEDRIRTYCKLHDLELIEIIREGGISGTKNNRPGFNRLLSLVRSKEVQAVVVYSLSRFARNTMAAISTIDLMAKSGIEFHSLVEKIDTSSPTGRFMITVISALAQMESEQTSDRVRSTIDFCKKQGKIYCREVYGFNHNLQTKELEDNIKEQVVLKDIFSRHIKNRETPYEIAKWLNANGIRSKSGKKWSHRVVGYMLQNDIYKSIKSQIR